MRRAVKQILVFALLLLLLPVAARAQYMDVEGHWAAEAIERWSACGVVSGSTDGRFHPDAEMTRAQAATVLSRLLGLPEAALPEDCVDADPGAWYASFLGGCVQAGLLSGTGRGKLAPDGALTREQFFVMFARALHLSPLDKPLEFRDAEEVSPWAAGYLAALSERGVLSGTGSGRIAPKAVMNRASVLALLNAAIRDYAGRDNQVLQAQGGLTLVAAPGVMLRGRTERLIVSPGAEGGILTLDALRAGECYVDAPSVKLSLRRDTSLAWLSVAEEADDFRLDIGAETEAGAVHLSPALSELVVDGAAELVELTSSAVGSTVELPEGGRVSRLVISAPGVRVSGAGTAEEIAVGAPDVQVNGQSAPEGSSTRLGSPRPISEQPLLPPEI